MSDVTSKDVMFFSALIAAACTLFGGFALDCGMTFTGSALGVIAVVALCALFLAYLETPKGGKRGS